MDLSRFDVVVLGGGPAGTATALALRQAGVERVLVAEAGHYRRFRIGETVPPNFRLALDRLGLLDGFLAEDHEPCYGSASSWGGARLGYNDFILSPHGHGWHLDRLRFDRFLAVNAASAGADVRLGWQFADAQDEAWGVRLHFRDSAGAERTVLAGFVVDATGSRAIFARRRGARRPALETLHCRAGLLAIARDEEVSRTTWLEATEQGWWYAARVPGGRLLVAATSDADIARTAGLATPAGWKAALDRTRHVSKLVHACNFPPVHVAGYAALSGRLEPAVGVRWLAVGDAAATLDPLTSGGLLKALSTAPAAASAIAAAMRGDRRALANYVEVARRDFTRYCALRTHLYGLERRWPQAPFWSRRQDTVPAFENGAGSQAMAF